MPVSENFKKEVVDAVNKYREMHDCPPLEQSKELNEYAQEWANSLRDRGKVEHRPNTKYGENIYMASGGELTGSKAAAMWYSEIKHYDFATHKFSPNAGHFTQVIWKSSKKIGVGVASKGESVYVVANFDPPGNVLEQFKANIPPKK